MLENEIDCLEDVILFELQKLIQQGADRRLSFSKIWTMCSKAAPNIPGAPPPDALRKKFAKKLFESLARLEQIGFVAVHSKGFDRGKRITHITATARGVEYLNKTVFTHQGVTR